MDGVDLLAELIDDASRPITFPASKLPHEAARRMLEGLGVTIVDDAKPANVTAPDALPGIRRRGDERPAFEIVQARVREALERTAARGSDPGCELEAIARRWAA